MGYSPLGLRKAYSQILSPTHRFYWMLCASLLSQGTGKTLWKPLKDGLVRLEWSSSKIQRPDVCPTCLLPSVHHAWKPTGNCASPTNFHSIHTEKTGGVTIGHGCRPTTACCCEEKGPFPFSSTPQTGRPLPLLCPHPPRAAPALVLPSCSTRYQPTKAAEETLRYFFFLDWFSTPFSQGGSWKRVWGVLAQGKLWEKEGRKWKLRQRLL